MKSTTQLLDSLTRQWTLCKAANPQGKYERCSRPGCHRCNRGRDFRRQQRHHA
jgi:hypothetical protein